MITSSTGRSELPTGTFSARGISAVGVRTKEGQRTNFMNDIQTLNDLSKHDLKRSRNGKLLLTGGKRRQLTCFPSNQLVTTVQINCMHQDNVFRHGNKSVDRYVRTESLRKTNNCQ